jgi:subtilisin family serine protease
MSNYLTCLQFMLAPYAPGADPWHAGHPDRAPQILTNSWGCPEVEGCDLYSMRPAIDAFTAAGIFFVVAAGNTGPRCASITDPPANYANSLTVGAVDRTRHVAEFSSRGPAPDGSIKPDVLAPGVDVLSALPGGTYGELSGTSMATPHVAGVVALMWSANPSLIGDIARTRTILATTARPAEPTGKNCGTPADITGAGLVDALAAVQAAVALKPP